MFEHRLSMFPTLWAVLSIVLDTQDGKCENIKNLQEKYNTCRQIQKIHAETREKVDRNPESHA